MVVIVLAFIGLGWWQFQRGEGGNARSYVYALEWPSFAILVFGFWGKIIYDELHPKPDERGNQGGSGSGSRHLPYDAGHAPSDALTPATMLAASTSPGDRLGDAPGRTSAAGAAGDDDDPELAAYNRYLAELASTSKSARAEGRR
jgi:hypothetical protein